LGLHEDPAFHINSFTGHSFGSWEFDPRHRAGYLADVVFFNRERGVGLDEKEDDKDRDHANDLFDNMGRLLRHTRSLSTQRSNRWSLSRKKP
jgi:hypothetical protein